MSSELLDKIGRIVGPIIIVLQTAGVIYLASTVHFPDPPPQKISNTTGLPIWEAAPPAPDFLGPETAKVTEYISAFITGAASVVTIFLVSRRIDNKFGRFLKKWTLPSAPTRLPSTSIVDRNAPINRLSWTKYILTFILTAYTTVTFIALAAGIIFGGLGKLWAIIGIFHNIMEVCLLAALLQTGRKQFNFAIALLVVVTYGVLATGTTSQLPWYYDSLFFKFQGLILDFMLPLAFFRVAVYAKNNPPANPGDLENTPLLSGSGGGGGGSSFNPPRQLGYLVFASFVHLIGNISNMVGDNSPESLVVFDLSYLVAFPLYTIYVHNELNILDIEESSKIFDVPDTSIYEFILISLWGATASAILAFISVKNMD